MNIDEYFKSRYIGSVDLAGVAHPVVISAVKIERMPDEDNPDKANRPVVYFEGKKKGLILNKTNAKRIKALYGKETDDWIGQSIIIYPTECEAFGEVVDCVRVKREAPAPTVLSRAGSALAATANGHEDEEEEPNFAPPPPQRRSRKPAAVAEPTF